MTPQQHVTLQLVLLLWQPACLLCRVRRVGSNMRCRVVILTLLFCRLKYARPNQRAFFRDLHDALVLHNPQRVNITTNSYRWLFNIILVDPLLSPLPCLCIWLTAAPGSLTRLPDCLPNSTITRSQ